MRERLFFNPQFSQEFDWKNKFHLRVGSVRPHNKEQISNGLRDMSPETIRYRFLGSKRDFSEKELQYLTTLDGINHYAIGIEERTGINRGVGLIRLVRSSHSEVEAEIAITLIDAYQNLGLGSFLLDLIILASKERGIEILSFTFLPQNEAIIKLINRVAKPLKGQQTKDHHQLLLDIKTINLEQVKSRLAQTLPMIDIFDLKT